MATRCCAWNARSRQAGWPYPDGSPWRLYQWAEFQSISRLPLDSLQVAQSGLGWPRVWYCQTYRRGSSRLNHLPCRNWFRDLQSGPPFILLTIWPVNQRGFTMWCLRTIFGPCCPGEAPASGVSKCSGCHIGRKVWVLLINLVMRDLVKSWRKADWVHVNTTDPRLCNTEGRG